MKGEVLELEVGRKLGECGRVVFWRVLVVGNGENRTTDRVE